MATLEEIQQQQDNRDGLDALINSLQRQDTPLQSSVQNRSNTTTMEVPSDFYASDSVPVAQKKIPLYTNVRSVKDANPAAIFIDSMVAPNPEPNIVTNTVTTKATDELFSGLQAQMDTIVKEGDTLKKQAALTDLEGSWASAQADLIKQTRQVAELQTGLPNLQSQLAESERTDKLDPLYPQFLSDSPQTRQIRNDVEKAQSKALELTKRLISENPTIAAMQAKLGSFMKVQEHLLSGSYNRADVRQQKEDQLSESITPDAVKALTYANPAVANDPNKAASLGLNAILMRDKNTEALLSPGFTTKDLYPLAVTGNPVAGKALIAMHSDVTGLPIDSVVNDMKLATAFVNSEPFFVKQMTQMAASDPKYTTLLQEYTKAFLGKTGKEVEKEKQLTRMQISDQFLTDNRTKIALNDVRSWNGDINLRSNPELAATVDTLKTLQPNAPIPLKLLVNKFVMSAPKEQQADRMDLIRQAAVSYANKNNAGLYGNIDLPTLESQLKLSTSWFNSEGLGGAINTWGDTMANYVNNDSPSLSGVPSFGAR